jgi:hypothetical protein
VTAVEMNSAYGPISISCSANIMEAYIRILLHWLHHIQKDMREQYFRNSTDFMYALKEGNIKNTDVQSNF